ncbi:MAG: HU family DNA-binding protein, partial [Prevotella sp.]|nr:HU family DNA-binding protein [Prevotella sp.]
VVAQKHKLQVKSTETFISQMFSVIDESLNTDQQVKIKGLGTFKVTSVKQRESVNIKTGERVVIEEHSKISFTPDAAMKEIVNKPFAQFETVIVNDDVDFSQIDKEFEEQLQEDLTEEDNSQTGAYGTEETLETPIVSIAPAAEVVSKQDYEEVQRKLSEARLEVNTANEELEKIRQKAAVLSKENDEAKHELAEFVQELKDVRAEKDKAIKELESVKGELERTKDKCIQANEVAEQVKEKLVKTNEETKAAREQIIRLNKELQEKNDTEAITPFLDTPEQSNRNKWLYALLGLILTLAGFLAGFLVGKNVHLSTTDKEIVQDVKQIADTATTDTVLTKKPVVTGQPTDKLNLEKINADARVKYGAYEIIGIDTTITLRKGQTMQSVSRATLGPDMVCYFQALNDTSTLGEGDKLKVPKIKVKKRK